MLHVMCYQGVNELVGGNLLFVTICSNVGVKVLGIHRNTWGSSYLANYEKVCFATVTCLRKWQYFLIPLLCRPGLSELRPFFQLVYVGVNNFIWVTVYIVTNVPYFNLSIRCAEDVKTRLYCVEIDQTVDDNLSNQPSSRTLAYTVGIQWQNHWKQIV